MDQNKKLIGFYGGTIGPWIPMITMIVLMIISTAKTVCIWLPRKETSEYKISVEYSRGGR